MKSLGSLRRTNAKFKLSVQVILQVSMQFATLLEKKETIKLFGLYLVQRIVAVKALHNWTKVIFLLLSEESWNKSHMTNSLRNTEMQ